MKKVRGKRAKRDVDIGTGVITSGKALTLRWTSRLGWPPVRVGRSSPFSLRPKMSSHGDQLGIADLVIHFNLLLTRCAPVGASFGCLSVWLKFYS